MQFLVACDSFKDALNARDVCAAISRGLAQAHPQVEIVQCPLSDGGEGILDVLGPALSLETVAVDTIDAIGRPILAHYGLSRGGEMAFVEMAQASGLESLTLQERDPSKASSRGTGLMIADARRRGAKRIMLAVGGSATNDAGTGAAGVLGWRFLDHRGGALVPSGGMLSAVRKLVPPKKPVDINLDILCDVTNPLFGPNGAAYIYARQKGADDVMIAALDNGLRTIADCVEHQLDRPGLAAVPGAGAAGGMAFGGMAFLGGRLRRGIDAVLELVDFDEALAGTDVVITGEGRIDGQSGQGKLVQGVCERAARTGVPVIALCGRLDASPEEQAAIGLSAAYSINPHILDLATMLAETGRNLERAAAELPLPPRFT